MPKQIRASPSPTRGTPKQPVYQKKDSRHHGGVPPPYPQWKQLDLLYDMHRYTVTKIDSEWHGGALEPPMYEVRRNRGGTASDWNSGEYMGAFDTQAEADTFAEQLRTLTLPACPRCGEKLSSNSLEQYCAYTQCGWNNEQI